MEITEIIRIVNLIKKANCEDWVTVVELAKEMGVKKTVLMQFIEDNPKLFKVVPYIGGITNDRKKKNAGLVIKAVYNSADENPVTDEWLAVMKKKWEKKLHIFGKYYYGCLEFYFIDVDGKDSDRHDEYRNTPEKIKELEDAGILKRERRCYGGWGDASYADTFVVSGELLSKLADAGWSTDFEKVSAANKDK